MTKLITVIGHGVELLPHFINHYTNYVDEINIAVYVSDISPNIDNEVKEIIKNYDNVKVIKTIKDRIFDWEKVTQLYNMVTNKSPNDWWVVADIDEFHLYPIGGLNHLINDCEQRGYDIVRGGFIDRIGPNGEFVDLNDTETIWKQFPNAGFFRYPMSGANPNKICLMRGYVELTNGQHYAKFDGHTTWKWQGWSHPLINSENTIQVHHFKWDKTAIERIKAVAEIKESYAYSTEYSTMFHALRKTKFKINLNNADYMFQQTDGIGNFDEYTNWNKLIKKIMSI